MPRVMTIWLPRWPVQRRLVERPEWRKRPVFVCRREARGVMTVVSWAWAEPPKRQQATIQPGMSLAEAMGVLSLAYGSRACHAAETDTDDPVADMAALEKLARMCRRFSPIVGIEAVPSMSGRRATGHAVAAECLHIDVTNTSGFFGGEETLARTAAWTLAARGLHARTAIADTPAAAWAAVHHTDLVAKNLARPLAATKAESGTPKADEWNTKSRTCGHRAGMTPGEMPSPNLAWRRSAMRHCRSVVVPPGAQRLAHGEGAMLAGLPLTALRLEPAAIGMLHEVGINTIGGLLRLPAKSLASRFPASVSKRLAELTGARAEPIEPPRGEQLPQASHDFEMPLSLASVDEAAMASLLEQLVRRCTTSLAARGEGIMSLQVRLEPAVTAAATTTHAPTVIDVGLFRPSGAPRHVVDLVRLRMGRMKLPREIESIAVEVIACGRITCRQRPLFDTGPDGRGETTVEAQTMEVGLLLDRLAGRLGRPAVFEPQLVADAQPEHAWIATAPGMAASRSSGGRFSRGAIRPAWMPPRPIPLDAPSCNQTISVVPDGPPARFQFGGTIHHVARAHGPERIETAWWRGPTVRRDYYVVETESGARFWLFRRLGGRARTPQQSGWYLHGVFA